MDMCYDGTLVMPSSYAVMEEDEMCYVDGGIKAQRNMTAGDAELELKYNVNFYAAIAAGGAIIGVGTSVLGIGIAAAIAAGGAGKISSAMYTAWQQAKNILNKYGKNKKVHITEELTINPIGYTCTCKTGWI